MGGVPVWSIRGLYVLSAATLLAWVLSWAAGRVGPPRLPGPLLLCIGWLLVQGWWMTFNAGSRYDPAHKGFHPIAAPFPAAPGAVDALESRLLMLRLSGILGLMCLTCDLARRPRWRRRVWWAIVLAGSSVALFGLVHRVAPVAMVAEQMERRGGVPFATFNYHGNAGSFINLILPLAAGLVLALVLRRERRSRLAARILGLIAVGALAACTAAAFVNASKAAALVTLLLLGVLALSLARAARTDRRGASGGVALPLSRRRLALNLLMTVLAVVAVTTVVGTGASWERWQHYLASRERGGPNPRVLVWRIGWAMAKEAGAFGYGPGSFKLLFPHTPHMIRALYPRWIVHEHTPGGRVSIWSHAHQDYLQTVIEWGWVGTAAWATLLTGGLRGLIRTCSTRRRGSAPGAFSDRVLAFCTLVALAGVLLHATIDFPLQIASVQCYLAVYLGLGWAQARPPAGTDGHNRRGEVRHSAPGASSLP